MSDYLEARREARNALNLLMEMQEGYHRLCKTGGGHNVAQLEEFVSINELQFREKIEEIQYNPNLQCVIGAEPDLQEMLFRILAFYRFLMENKLITVPEEQTPKEADTAIPPEPPYPVDDKHALEYVVALRDWIDAASDDLWREDNPIDLPPMGGRLGIGDWEQQLQLTLTLNEGKGLRNTWLQLASCGNQWEQVNVGAARAKMIYQAKEILQACISSTGAMDHQHPPLMFGGLLG